MNKLKSFTNKATDLAAKGVNKAAKGIDKLKKEKTLKVDFKIQVKIVKLTVTSSTTLPDLMYRLEWKRGPDTFTSRLIDIKSGSENTNDITDTFSKVSSFHTKELDKEISAETVWEPKICNFILKRQDDMA